MGFGYQKVQCCWSGKAPEGFPFLLLLFKDIMLFLLILFR